MTISVDARLDWKVLPLLSACVLPKSVLPVKLLAKDDELPASAVRSANLCACVGTAVPAGCVCDADRVDMVLTGKAVDCCTESCFAAARMMYAEASES